MKASPRSRLLWGPGRCSQSSLREKSTVALRPGPAECPPVHHSRVTEILGSPDSHLSQALTCHLGHGWGPPSPPALLHEQPHSFLCFFVWVWLHFETKCGITLVACPTRVLCHGALCTVCKHSTTKLHPWTDTHPFPEALRPKPVHAWQVPGNRSPILFP